MIEVSPPACPQPLGSVEYGDLMPGVTRSAMTAANGGSSSWSPMTTWIMGILATVVITVQVSCSNATSPPATKETQVF